MSAIYESDKLLAEYLLFHFGTQEEILPPTARGPPGMREALDFPCRTVAHFSPEIVDRGLDLGCAVGRSTFEMARTCRRVIGIDFSHAFIHAAEALREWRVDSPIDRREEAAIATRLDGACTGRNRSGPDCVFQQGDAMHLPADLGFLRPRPCGEPALPPAGTRTVC